MNTVVARLLTPVVGFGAGRCRRCQVSWRLTEPHNTTYAKVGHGATGVIAVCEPCWVELETPEARLPFYRLLIDEQIATDKDKSFWQHNRQWQMVRLAVLEGK